MQRSFLAARPLHALFQGGCFLERLTGALGVQVGSFREGNRFGGVDDIPLGLVVVGKLEVGEEELELGGLLLEGLVVVLDGEVGLGDGVLACPFELVQPGEHCSLAHAIISGWVELGAWDILIACVDEPGACDADNGGDDVGAVPAALLLQPHHQDARAVLPCSRTPQPAHGRPLGPPDGPMHQQARQRHRAHPAGFRQPRLRVTKM